MVSFASPLFWQIQYLVTTLSKKNFKTSVAELNQLVGLYGEDARIFLLNCLVREVDFKDARSQQKDALKLQLLSHEIAQASSRPNFTTFICEAIESSAEDSQEPPASISVTEDFLHVFCRTLRLNLPQQLTIGLAFAQGSKQTTTTSEAVAFLRSKVPEIAGCGAKLPPDVLHALVYVLRVKDEFRTDVAETDSFIASIAASHPSDMGSMEMTPLTMGEPDYVDCQDLGEADVMLKLVNDVAHSCVFYQLMEDVGYACTASPQAFRTLLAEAGLQKAPTIPPAQVAGMLEMLSRTCKGLDNSSSATLMADLPEVYEASAGNLDDDNDVQRTSSLTTWNMGVIVEVLHADYPSIKWTKVADKLDQEGIFVESAAQLKVLLSAFEQLAQTKFKVATLLRPWKHARAQLSFLRAAIECPPDVISFTDSPNKLSPFEGADASAVPANGVWFSLDVVETLLSLSEKDCYGDVRRVFESAVKTCPDVLIANLALAQTHWNGLRDDVFSELFNSYIAGRSNTPAMMRHLWSVAPKLVLYASVKCFYAATSSTTLHRLFVLFRSTGDSLSSAIHSNYFSFALALAVVGANQNEVNLESWLVERLAAQRTAFATSCLAFVHRNYARAIPKAQVTAQTAHLLSIESLALILKSVMAIQSALPSTVTQELRRIATLCMEAHPVISSATRSQNESVSSVASAPADVNSRSDTSESTASYTAEMIEEQANAYFQQIYTSEQNINDVVAMLKRFHSSREERERQIFYCMIHNLFDEYRFFPRYPEAELRITGVLFGKLIEHQVLPPNFLQTALRSVLESLREPVNSKFFFFGACALQQFVPRLAEMPAYCANLGQIPHLQQALPEIMRQVNHVTSSSSAPPAREEVVKSPDAAAETAAAQMTPAEEMPSRSPSPKKEERPVLQVDHIFDKELASDENEPIEQPEESVRDRMNLIVNNLSLSNLDAKLPEVQQMLSQENHYPWMANYLVVKRIATQPNYHPMYMVLIEKLTKPALETEILKRTLQNARRLLTSSTITTNTQQRSLLKNLGSWLGLLTLSRDKPLLQSDLDLKELLYVGYESGHLIAVTPFVAKVLEGCKKSKIFKPPNPWIMGLIHAMSEIYDVPDLKLNLKFEIEVLFKSFKLNVEEQRKANLLHTRKSPPRVANPDFNMKTGKVTRAATPPLANQKGGRLGNTPSKGKPEGYAPSGSPPSANYPPSSVSSPMAESTVIPNLASYVAVNPDLPLHNVNLKRLVPLAVDRAIREVISPVVERSVTIACITTRELILKDFAAEPDEAKMRKAAHLMVGSLSGSLALITAKEPLRTSIGNHLRALMPTSAADAQHVEHVVVTCSNENTDLGCMLIEKASSEKAMRDIDEALTASYAARRRHASQNKTSDSVTYFENASQPPENLPKVFHPKAGGVPTQQLQVYESFQRIPRPTSMPLSRAYSNEKESAGVTLPAALDRFAGLMEKFEVFVQNVARQATASQREIPSLLHLSGDSEVFVLLKEVRALGQSVKPSLREEASAKIANRIVKCMYELGAGRGDGLFLEIMASALEALSASNEKLKKEVVSWVLHTSADDKLKLHCEVIVALVRFKAADLRDFDMYLARNMERNGVAVEFAVHVVRQCLSMDHVNVLQSAPTTLEALARIVERHGPQSSNKNVQILANLLEQVRTQRQKVKSGKPDQAAFRHTVSNALEHWIAVCKDASNNSKVHAQYMQMLKQYGLLADDESMALFFKFGTELCVDACLKNARSQDEEAPTLNYGILDALTYLMSLLIKYFDPSASAKLQVMNHAVGAIANVLASAHEASRKQLATFDQRVFFRLLANLMTELTKADPALEAVQLQILNTFASALNSLQPLTLPGFAFAWTELISHRSFMPLLLRAKNQRGWQILHRLLLNLFVFLEPFLRRAESEPLSDSISALYDGATRIILVLLHDYPEFLSEFYPSFCDVLPSSCVQLRNVILSAFSRSMRLPDPLTVGLEISQLPEVSVSPKLMPAWGAALQYKGLKEYVDAFLKAQEDRSTYFPKDIVSKLQRPSEQLRDSTTSKYAVPALNALVLYLGKEAISEMAGADATQGASFEQTASMEVFRYLAEEMDAEGRYWFFSSLANHLRYPNAHTHYFSCVLLYLFSNSSRKQVKEQITRVLIERLIAKRPHPWGLLVTFIELIRNKSYKFWEQEFLESSDEIKKIFDDVARTCLGTSGESKGDVEASRPTAEVSST